MDTIVYIDGYNLFYGRLRHSPFKWLDVVKLFQAIAKVQNPSANIVKVKYSTAPVKANFASHGRNSVTAQNNYHRALEYLYQQRIEIIKGYHTVERGYPPSQGQLAYESHCISCHSNGINGAPIPGKPKMWASRIVQGVPVLVDHAINGYGFMPAKGGKESMSDADVEAAVKYMIR